MLKKVLEKRRLLTFVSSILFPVIGLTSLLTADRMEVKIVAGIGHPGSKDGSLRSASFNWPTDIAVDDRWNLYVADFNNNKIRKIYSLNGMVTTLAGKASKGYIDGDGSEAEFDGPNGIALDKDGNLYVADAGNARIRKITPEGIVSTIAGSGRKGLANGPSMEAEFVYPTGIAIDRAENIYIVDRGGHQVRKLTPDGMVLTVAGIGVPGFKDGPSLTARFHDPLSIAIDEDGNLFVTDAGNHAIRKITPEGTVKTLAGGEMIGFRDGWGTDARFGWPTGISINAKGEVFVAEGVNNRIRKISKDGFVTTFAGNGLKGYADGPPKTAKFNFPTGVEVDSKGDVYISDSGNNGIRRIGVKGLLMSDISYPLARLIQ